MNITGANTIYNLLLVLAYLRKSLRGFSIPLLFTKLVARNTQQTIYKTLTCIKPNYTEY